MRKTLIALAWAAIPALMLSACNGTAAGGGPGLSAVPNAPHVQGRVHRNDDGAGDLHGGGATFPAYGYNLGCQPAGYALNTTSSGPNTEQQKPCAGSMLANVAATSSDGNNYYYCLTGSGYGKNEFDDNSEQTGTDECQPIGPAPTGFGGRTNPLDWIGSDIALASTECCGSSSHYGESPYYGTASNEYGTTPLEVPTFGGPIVFPYINCKTCGTASSPAGLTGLGKSQLKLSTWTYCAIADGIVGYWDDPAITADNGGVKVAGHQQIIFVYRSDKSGTTYLFENKMSNSAHGCNQTWKGVYAKAPYQNVSNGRNVTWTFAAVNPAAAYWTGYGEPGCGACIGEPTGSGAPYFVGANGNPAVLQTVQGLNTGTVYFPYATGYAEGAWAAAASNPSVDQAALQNGKTFVNPEDPNNISSALSSVTKGKIAYGMGSDGNSLGTGNGGICELYVPPSVFVNPGAGSYPIVGLSYFMFYNQNQERDGSNHYADLAKLIKYMDSAAWNNALPNLEYVPLPASVQKAVQTAAFGKGKKHTDACFNQ